MLDREDHSPHRGVVGKRPLPADPPQPERLERALLRVGESDAALHLADHDRGGASLAGLARRAGHRASPTISSTAKPRSFATSEGSLSLIRASMVALTTLCGLAVPSDFVSTSWTPRTSR